MKPLWTRPASEVTESEYAEFYKHISHDFSDPLYRFAARAEGLLEYQALVFFPSKAPYDLFYQGFESGLRLYAKGVKDGRSGQSLSPEEQQAVSYALRHAVAYRP